MKPKDFGVPGEQMVLRKEDPPPPALTSWALVELFGHQRIVGWVTVDPVDFPGMVRVDVPDLLKNGKVERKGFTRYLGRGALYAVNPISEASVRELLPHVTGMPARPIEMRYPGEEWEP